LGIWSSLIGLVEEVLRILYSVTHNYGLAIILLTIIIRVLLYPLMQKQMTSMRETQKIQPLMQDIQKKYKNDKERLNQELMKLYKEHKVNPMGGCLPLLIQMPILILFFQVLRGFEYLNPITKEVSGGFLWIPNIVKHTVIENGTEITKVVAGLAAPEKLFEIAGYSIGILPILVGLTMFIQQKLTTPAVSGSSQNSASPNPAAGTQKMMTTIMPLMIGFISFTLPSGLSLYWVTSTLFGIGQQLLINKKDPEVKKVESIVEDSKDKVENKPAKQQKEQQAKETKNTEIEEDMPWIPGYEKPKNKKNKKKNNT